MEEVDRATHLVRDGHFTKHQEWVRHALFSPDASKAWVDDKTASHEKIPSSFFKKELKSCCQKPIGL